MNLHDLRPASGSRRKAKRLGQGMERHWQNSGKGNKARSQGRKRRYPLGFEAVRLPITRRFLSVDLIMHGLLKLSE